MLMLQVMEEQAKSRHGEGQEKEGGDKVCDKDDILHLDRRETPLHKETFRFIEEKQNNKLLSDEYTSLLWNSNIRA